jgi:hypothetical protein
MSFLADSFPAHWEVFIQVISEKRIPVLQFLIYIVRRRQVIPWYFSHVNLKGSDVIFIPTPKYYYTMVRET